jgi:hypothetical protein
MLRSSVMLRAFRYFFYTFLPLVKRLLDPFGAMAGLQIVYQDDYKLITKNDLRQYKFNRRDRTVRSGTRVVAYFDQFKVIKVRRISAENTPDCWAVYLRLNGSLIPFYIGVASDEFDAEIVASQIGTITGKQVRTL